MKGGAKVAIEAHRWGLARGTTRRMVGVGT